MAQKVNVLMVCDLHDEQEVEAAETVVFGLDGATYEIELCEDDGQRLREAVGPYAAAARRSGRRSGAARSSKARPRSAGRGTPAAARPTTASGGAQTAARQWARAHGYPVSARGRLSAQVIAAYEAAQ